MEARYRSTLWACCFANFFQAVGSCFAILYVPLRGLYGLSFTDFGILVSLNFITQVASDVLFSKPVEKYGFRPFAVAAPLVSAAGLGLFAAAPLLFPRRPFAGFCAGMFLFAAAGGAGAMYAVMRLIRHKTLHRKFMLGLPALLALHVALLVALHLLLL